MVASSGLALAIVLSWSPMAQAGTPGPTVSLGKAGGLEYLTAKFENVSSQAGAPAMCDAGQFATGGGGSISGPTVNANLNTSIQSTPDAGWLAEGRALGGGSRTVKTYAICGEEAMTYVTDTNNFSAGTSFNAGIPCPGTSRATSGGVRGNGGNLLIRGMHPYSDLDVYDWIDSIQNPGPGSTAATTSASCSDAYEPTYRSEVTRIEAGQAGTVVAPCKKNEVVAGGGPEVTRQGLGQDDVWAIATRPWDTKDDRNKTPEDGWLARSYNGTGAKVKLTTFASCLKK